MRRISPLFATALLGPMLLLGPLAGPAARAADHDAVRNAVEAGRLKPLAPLLAALEKQYNGRVLDVELERDLRGRQVYEVKLVEADGRRREIYLDAMSGTVVAPPDESAIALKPLAGVLRGLLADHPGRVLDVELEWGQNGRQVYEVRIVLADGRIREFIVDAHTGQLRDADAKRLAALASLRPLPELLDIVLARYPGTVREVELEHDREGRRYYEVDLRLADGRLLEGHIDAVTGQILPTDPSD